MAQLLSSRTYQSISHEILRQYGEYERISTTVLNSYIGPTVSAYLEGLERMLRNEGFAGRLEVMQSNGGVMSVPVARRLPVAMLESGPSGWVYRRGGDRSCPWISQCDWFRYGRHDRKSESFVRDGEPQMSHGYHIGGYAFGQPMMLPVVDTVEVGSGGGSIARVDHTGSLRVGPVSAGADPGPACYGKGGTEPTVTDANLLLGRLDPAYFLGGEMQLDVESAREAINRCIARPLGLTEIEAARSIVKVAMMNMSLAVRQVSVERGYDPRDFVMVGFGGAGPLHAAEVARSLHIPVLVIPNFPGSFPPAECFWPSHGRILSAHTITPWTEQTLANWGELPLAWRRWRGSGLGTSISACVTLWRCATPARTSLCRSPSSPRVTPAITRQRSATRFTISIKLVSTTTIPTCHWRS